MYALTSHCRKLWFIVNESSKCARFDLAGSAGSNRKKSGPLKRSTAELDVSDQEEENEQQDVIDSPSSSQETSPEASKSRTLQSDLLIRGAASKHLKKDGRQREGMQTTDGKILTPLILSHLYSQHECHAARDCGYPVAKNSVPLGNRLVLHIQEL